MELKDVTGQNNGIREILSFEEINKRLGGFGRYQKRIYFILCLPVIFCAFQKLAKNFLQYEPNFRCQLPGEDNNSLYEINNRTIKDYYQPKECSYLLNNHTETCNGKYIYDKSVYTSTIVTEWDLVCEKTYSLTMSESIFMSGVMFGSMLFGYLSDRCGRKKIFILSLFLQTIFGFSTAFAPNFIVYVIGRFIIGASVSGVFLIAYVIALEMVTPEMRQTAGVGMTITFSIGYCSLTLFAYIFRDWRMLQMSITVACLLFFSYWWLIPESVRWLIANNHNDEAKRLLKKMAATNKISYAIDSIEFENESKTKPEEKVSLYDIFRNPVLCKRVLIIFLSWLVNSATYYGLSWNVSSLGNNIFLDYLLSGAVEFPANISLLFLLNRFGRRKIICSFMMLAGVSLLITAYFDNNWMFLVLTLIGKSAITGSYSTIYVFTVEQFPTSIRNTILGASSTSARIGGILAPQINLLGRYWKPFPGVIFGIAAIISGMLSYLLPETTNKNLPDSFTDSSVSIDNNTKKDDKNEVSNIEKPVNGFAILYS